VLLTRLPLTPKSAFDLHVLSLPPAFALSQDQTLKLKSLSGWSSRELTEFTSRRRFQRPVSFRNVIPPKSLFDRSEDRSARTPPSTLLFLSSLVKERVDQPLGFTTFGTSELAPENRCFALILSAEPSEPLPRGARPARGAN
jgi:hypothetical protein